MLFNVRGIEMDVAVPKSLAEVNGRIEKLVARHQQMQKEIKKLPPKSVPRQIKGHEMQELGVELQILKRWRKRVNIRLEDLLNDPNIDSGELETEAGLLKHLHQEIRRLNREHCFSIERDSKLATVLSAAQLWLRNYYSTKLPPIDLAKEIESEDEAHLQQHQMQQDQFDRQFQERERIRWQEHLLQQQNAASPVPSNNAAQRDQEVRDREARIRQARQERQRKQQEEALRQQRDQAETQAAMQLISQLSKQQLGKQEGQLSKQGGQ
ncbi:MAG: hypothetical protein HC895_19670 [Leptolyngbyaceae cyanobacterium SM1_3_5]|nr:hypothetical protein [Leptolyngbyaceae cyanobacterium SM1_3_5]